MFYIFNASEVLIAVIPLKDVLSAKHKEVLNGQNTFTFSYLADKPEAEYIADNNLVAFKDLDGYWQFFEVKKIVDLHGDGLTRTAYCEHIFYELLDDIITDKRPSADAAAALNSMLEGTRWQIGIVDNLGAAKTNVYYESVLSGVQKVANAWDGELRWRCVINGGVITRYVDLLKMRGIDTGKQFVYGKDIHTIEREEDSTGVATALYGRGKGVETESGDSYGRRLTFADVEWKKALGDPVDKPLGQEWVGHPEALLQSGRNGRHKFDVYTDEEETDAVKLLENTWNFLDTAKRYPKVTYRLKAQALEKLSGYKHEAVRLGDLTRVIDREFKPELLVSARIIELERDLLNDNETNIVLGNFAPTIVEATFNIDRKIRDVANKPYNTKWLDGVIDVLQNAIQNTQAYVFETPQGTLHLDAPTYEQATSAMLLGGGRFAIANQKDGNGGWNWRTFGDGSGFTADLINAGKIKSSLIEVGPESTFAEGYDPSQIQGGAAMGVDADCVGLWHFDGSLNSHKGAAADSDAAFDAGCFGQALNIATGKHLKVPTTDMSASAGNINLRAKNLAATANSSVIIDLPDSSNIEGLRVGIASDGKIYVKKIVAGQGETVNFSVTETNIEDFGTGTLSNVWAKDGGLQLDTTTVRTWNDFTGANWEVLT